MYYPTKQFIARLNEYVINHPIMARVIGDVHGWCRCGATGTHEYWLARVGSCSDVYVDYEICSDSFVALTLD